MFYMPRNRIAIDSGVSPTLITSCGSDFGCSTLWYAEEKPMEKVMLKRGYEVEIERERVY